MRILLVSDAWLPQVNGVVRTLLAVVQELTKAGHDVRTITPDLFHTVPCPGYAEIRLALGGKHSVSRLIEEAAPDAIHIATEGPLGLAARRWCVKRGYAFTTAFHTRFPEYLAARVAVPERWTYHLLRWFHGPSRGVMVATESMRRELKKLGFDNLRPWGRGVDTSLFAPGPRTGFGDLPRPIFVCVGRVAPEKNLPAFLDLDLPGSKVVIGDGPALPELQQRYPGAHFLGRREHRALADLYASADVFVFPSRTDTFGLVLLEALASGVPVAAYPVPGPIDVVGDSGAGVLSDDLRAAALGALKVPRDRCRAHAQTFTWQACARQFLENLTLARA
jgi:glycosyltransferase involved in cell wall biosynthesis